jgi:hypothetical protein
MIIFCLHWFLRQGKTIIFGMARQLLVLINFRDNLGSCAVSEIQVLASRNWSATESVAMWTEDTLNFCLRN